MPSNQNDKNNPIKVTVPIPNPFMEAHAQMDMRHWKYAT